MSQQFSFQLQYNTQFLEAIYLYGGCEELGYWNFHLAKRMTWKPGNIWCYETDQIAQKQFEYKYFVANYDNPVDSTRIECGSNRTVNTENFFENQILLNDVWEFKKSVLFLTELPVDTADNYRLQNHNICQDIFKSNKNHTSDSEDVSFCVTVDIEFEHYPFNLGELIKCSIPSQEKSKSDGNEDKELIYWKKEFLMRSYQNNFKYQYNKKKNNNLAGITTHVEESNFKEVRLKEIFTNHKGHFCTVNSVADFYGITSTPSSDISCEKSSNDTENNQQSQEPFTVNPELITEINTVPVQKEIEYDQLQAKTIVVEEKEAINSSFSQTLNDFYKFSVERQTKPFERFFVWVIMCLLIIVPYLKQIISNGNSIFQVSTL